MRRPTGAPILFTEAVALVAERTSLAFAGARGAAGAAANATVSSTTPLRNVMNWLQPGGLLSKPSTKAALLALCGSMLRFGVLRTLVAMLAAALAYDLLVGAGRGVQQWLRPRENS